MSPAVVSGKAYRILMADDHDTYRKTIISLLEHRGYQVTDAACGEEVLAVAVDHPFDLFVLDYKMPGNEDLILVEQLHAVQPDVPVILLTGFASLPSAMSAVRLQLFDYIQKGEAPDHLLNRIDEAIRHTQLEKELRESESRYRLLAENILDVITVFSKDRKAVYASPSVEKVLGYTPDEVREMDIYELVHLEDRAGLKQATCHLLANGSVIYDARFRTRTGRYIWLSTSAKLLRETSELICSSRDITDRKMAGDRIRKLAQYLETVREDERKRLSRELHDDIGQILTALKIDLATVHNECACTGRIKKKMADMQKLLTDGIQSVHSLCRQLRPGALDDLGLEDAVAGLVDDWSRRTGVDCDIATELAEEKLTDGVKIAVFRIIQESLTNVSRHARASSVKIHLTDGGGKVLCFSITDDGCGMEAGAEKKTTAFGLLGMHERVEALCGTLRIESIPGKGTRIEGSIPL